MEKEDIGLQKLNSHENNLSYQEDLKIVNNLITF
jgi:hypothetical protein